MARYSIAVTMPEYTIQISLVPVATALLGWVAPGQQQEEVQVDGLD